MTMVAHSKFPGSVPKCGVARVLCLTLALCLTTTAYSAAPSLEAVNKSGRPLQLGTSYDLGYSLSKSAGTAEALSLAHGDFNTDGFQDLVSGYATDAGGMVTLHRGNEQAYAPTTAASLAGVKQGVFPPGFVAQSSLYSVPVAPDLMAAGDFNRDGDMDLLVAKRGDAAMYFLSGSRSGFAAAQKVALAGGVDALAAGQIDVPDGMTDLAVAISGTSGASLLVYNELAGINGEAQSYKLPAAADALEVGNLDDSAMGDIAILANGKAHVLHGFDQNAKATTYNRLETLDFDFPIQAFALGNFIWDRANSTEFALLKADGSVQFAARGALNTTAFSVAEARALRRQQAAVKSVALKSWQPGQGGAWNIVESTEAQLSKGIAVRGAKLLSARLSGNPGDDLVIVDALTQSLQILSKSGDTRSVSKVAATSAPVAAIAMQTSSFVLDSLISLGEGAQAASVLPSAPLLTFTVSKTADTNDGACNADCSLREAIRAANVAAGADSIVLPAGTYQLTIANGGGLNEDDNAQGDLDVNDALTITGAGAATTIVSAGTTTANGIDKVFAFNPICVTPMATAISGITISFGRNTQPTSAPDFSYTGGGMDWCGTGNSSMTVTNSTITNNTNTLGYGGGINLDSFAANGSVTITGTTISTNRTLSTLGNNTGGGVNLFADQHGVSITNSTITGNTAAGEGGGLFARHTNGGAVLVQATNISNNTAASRGGGISNINLGVSTFTINQDSTVVSNISQGLVGLAAEGGGIYSSASATTTINEVTITGNAANGAGVPEQRGGGGIATGGGTVNVTFNRIVGNTALGLGGSGIHKDLNPGTTTATNNWWGCNAGAASAPCDRAVSAGGAGVTLTSTPHLVLNHTATPNAIVFGQTSALTADFLTNSASAPIAVANLDAIIGTAHSHQNPVLGTHSATQTSIQAAGNATATFTATGVGAGSSDSVVDSQTRTVAITISKANTTTTITADSPDPSISGNAITVAYSVAVVGPGAGTPTGNVVVTISGGAETCTGTVAAGSCSITLVGGGARTLTATYAGDSNFNSSNDTEPHTVTVCPSVVTNGNDTGAGSLRDVVANACPGSTITFQAGVSTVTLTSAEISINKNLTIDGGAGLVTVTRSTAGGTPNFRIFNVLSGNTVSMNALTVSNGNHPSQSGGIQNSGSLTLTNMLITGNRSPQSGGLQNDSVLNLSNSSVTNNVASNFAGGLGIAGSGTTTLANCTFAGNQGGSDTGAIGAGGTSLSITNCTISGNTLVNVGGLGAGITINGVPTTIRNTIVVGNTEGGGSQRNIDGSLQAASAFNVLGTGPAGGLVNGTNNNQVGVTTALLGSLANYGGLTPTLPLLPGSVAINTGTAVSAPANDQRGVARVGAVDVGAFESRGFSVTQTSGSPQTAVINTPFASPLIATVASANSEPVTGGVVSFTAPGAGASAVLGSPTATIAANGQASTSATANATTGNYTVSANTSGNLGSAVSFSLTNRDLSANLSITKTNGTTTSVPGGSTTYTITASNAGPDPVTGATAADTFPASLTCTWTCVGAGGGTCTASGSGNINNSVNLPVGASVTYTASCAISPSATGSLGNTATISSSIADPQLANNSATDTDTLTPQANVSITKTDGQSSVNAGTNTTYTITASNAGPSNAPGTTVADTFPAACTSVNWTCAGSAGGTCSAAGSGNINDSVNLPSGGSVVFSATCAISTGATGTLVNTATVAVAGGITDPNTGNNSATDTNTINDFPTLAINDVSIIEGNSGTQTLNFTVTRTGTTASAVGFSFATADDTATAGSDYVTATGTGTIPSGGATGTTTVSVTINGDAVFENTERFFVNLSAPTNATIADAQGIGTITNDDTAPTLAINDVSIIEGNAGQQGLVFTVTRTGLTALPASFTAGTADDTASAPSDYLAALAGSTSIAAGGATGTTTLTATINGDTLAEPDETFFVNLSGAANATITDAQGVGTILTDEVAPVLAYNPTTGTNINFTGVTLAGDTGSASISVTPSAGLGTGNTTLNGCAMSGPNAANFSGQAGVNFNFVGTTTAPQTISLSCTSATIQRTATLTCDETAGAAPPVQRSWPLTCPLGVRPPVIAYVPPTGSSAHAIGGNFGAGQARNVSIAATPSGGSGTGAEATTTINSCAVTGPGAPSFSGAGAINLSFVGSPTTAQAVALACTSDGADVTATLTCNEQRGSAAPTPRTWDVNCPTCAHTISSTLGAAAPALPANWSFATGTMTGRINRFAAVSTCAAPTAFPGMFTSTGARTFDRYRIRPLTAGCVRVRSQVPNVNLFFYATSLFDPANPGANYVADPGSSFPTLSTEFSFTATAGQDYDVVVHEVNSGAGVGTPYSLFVEACTQAVPSVTPSSVSISEVGPTSANAVVAFTAAPASNITATLTFDANVQVNTGSGFGNSPQTLTLTPANAVSGVTVAIRAVDDAIDEADPHTSIIVTSATSSADPSFNGVGLPDITASIADNDTAGITLTQTGGTTTATEGGATDTYALVLNSQPTANVSIALIGDAQATAATSPVVFTPGNWNIAQNVTVSAVDDNFIEGAHSGTISHAVTSGDANYNGFALSAVPVSISDNDTAGVTIVQSGGTTAVTEGGATDSYTLALTAIPTANVVINVGGDAQVGAAPTPVTFTPGTWNLPQTVTATAVNDIVVEGPHSGSISHSVSSADANFNGIAVGSVSVGITDNDSAVVSFNPVSVSQTEATSPMAFTVTLSAPVASGVSMALNSVFGTATAADFTPVVAGTVSFAPNVTTSQIVNVVINNDTLDEFDEQFTLTLTGLTATGSVSFGSSSATGTILDNDPAPTITITSPSQAEGNAGSAPMNFTASLSTISGRPVTFNAVTANDTATVANNDYAALASVLFTIPAGSLSVTIPVTIFGDAVYEGDESFTLSLVSVDGATPATVSGTGTIVDDDQQPTTTTITSDTPDPSVVGQPYAVAVTVTAQTTSPLGTVTISDGTDSCGPVVLATGTAPNSSATCNLTSTTAGAKTLTASYTAASTAFADSSGTTAHQVNAAATAISVVGPVRSRINQPTTFTFALSVNAPGAGSPAGTVTLSSGAASCNVTVPTVTPSCALTFTTLGNRTVSAAFAPSNGNFLASSSSGAGNALTLVYAQSDIAVTKTDVVGTYRPGDLLVYTVTVRNLGPDAAAVIRVRDQVPAGVVNVDWTCDASGGVACPAASGSGNLDVTVSTFPVGGLLNFTFFGNVSGSPAQIVNTALVELPADTTIEDPNLGNNSASDTNLLDSLFRNGFENAAVSAPAGSYRLPSLGLRGALDEAARVVYVLDDANGEALRVYARLLDGQVQYALASRNSTGELRLAAWSSYAGEPILSWTARAVAGGWVLEAVGLR